MSSKHVDLILLDDLKESESETVREEAVRWFKEVMPNRLNDMVRIAVLLDDPHRYKP